MYPIFARRIDRIVYCSDPIVAPAHLLLRANPPPHLLRLRQSSTIRLSVQHEDHAVYCSFLETNFVYLGKGTFLNIESKGTGIRIRTHIASTGNQKTKRRC